MTSESLASTNYLSDVAEVSAGGGACLTVMVEQ